MAKRLIWRAPYYRAEILTSDLNRRNGAGRPDRAEFTLLVLTSEEQIRDRTCSGRGRKTQRCFNSGKPVLDAADSGVV